MADVDGMMAIRAVDQEIKRHELLLTSGTLRDPEEIQTLISSYEKAADRLREAYEAEWTAGSNLPAYAKLVGAS